MCTIITTQVRSPLILLSFCWNIPLLTSLTEFHPNLNILQDWPEVVKCSHTATVLSTQGPMDTWTWTEVLGCLWNSTGWWTYHTGYNPNPVWFLQWFHFQHMSLLGENWPNIAPSIHYLYTNISVFKYAGSIAQTTDDRDVLSECRRCACRVPGSWGCSKGRLKSEMCLSMKCEVCVS